MNAEQPKTALLLIRVALAIAALSLFVATVRFIYFETVFLDVLASVVRNHHD